MDTREFDILWNTERSYWWFVGQRFLLSSFMRRYYGNSDNLQLLDVGCGAGLNLKLLETHGDALGLDVSDKAISFCQQRGLKTVKSDIMDIQLDEEQFDVVTALGVFYHKGITDDVEGFKQVHKVLKHGGRFFLLDCASKSLFGKHDIAFHGVRRYTKKELHRKLEEAGFIVERISYYNTTLFPFVWLHRKLGKLTKSKPKSEVQENLNPIVNWVLKKFYISELSVLKSVDLPFGVNIMAVARKLP